MLTVAFLDEVMLPIASEVLTTREPFEIWTSRSSDKVPPPTRSSITDPDVIFKSLSKVLAFVRRRVPFPVFVSDPPTPAITPAKVVF
jgi:hypothetical protein